MSVAALRHEEYNPYCKSHLTTPAAKRDAPLVFFSYKSCLCFPFVAGHERIPARSGRLAVRAYNMVWVPRLVTGSSGGVNELAPDRLQFEQ